MAVAALLPLLLAGGRVDADEDVAVEAVEVAVVADGVVEIGLEVLAGPALGAFPRFALFGDGQISRVPMPMPVPTRTSSRR